MSAAQHTTYRHYRGTVDELLAAGVFEPYMLERIRAAGGQACGRDEFGDHWVCRTLRDGELHLMRRAQARDRRAAATVERAAGPVVAALLARFSR